MYSFLFDEKAWMGAVDRPNLEYLFLDAVEAVVELWEIVAAAAHTPLMMPWIEETALGAGSCFAQDWLYPLGIKVMMPEVMQQIVHLH
jgi:hypothetical protein